MIVCREAPQSQTHFASGDPSSGLVPTFLGMVPNPTKIDYSTKLVPTYANLSTGPSQSTSETMRRSDAEVPLLPRLAHLQLNDNPVAGRSEGSKTVLVELAEGGRYPPWHLWEGTWKIKLLGTPFQAPC